MSGESVARKEWVLGWEARLLLLVTAGLVAIGLVSVYSASSALVEHGRPIGSTRALAGPFVLLTAVLLLVLVMPGTGAVAPRINGARRWLDVGVSIQVSEIA